MERAGVAVVPCRLIVAVSTAGVGGGGGGGGGGFACMCRRGGRR